MSDSFKSEIEKLIPSPYKLNSSTDEYDSIAAPIKSMEKLSTYVLIAAIGASLLIVSLVVLLFLRDRKHEFGVYLSLGEKKSTCHRTNYFRSNYYCYFSFGVICF